MQEVVLGSNYLSQQPTTLHFGLGSETEITRVDIFWHEPGLSHSVIENVEVDKRYQWSFE